MDTTNHQPGLPLDVAMRSVSADGFALQPHHFPSKQDKQAVNERSAFPTHGLPSLPEAIYRRDPANIHWSPSDDEDDDDEDDDEGAMDCDEDIEISPLHTRQNSRPRHGSSASNESIGSVVSSSSAMGSRYTQVPELSRSFGSTKSFDLMTPIRSQPMSAANISAPAAMTPSPVTRFDTSDGLVNDRLSKFSFGNGSPQMGSNSTLSPSPRPFKSLSTSSYGAINSDTDDEALQSPTSTTFNKSTVRGSRNPPPGLAGRLKINLPTNSLSSAFNNPSAPQTPGGRIASGARDGAASGSAPISPFEPPTPLNGPSAHPSSPFVTTTTSQVRPSPRPHQSARQSMPVITPVRAPTSSSTSTRRPQQMQRNGSLGLSPLSSEFAAVSMKKTTSTMGTASEVSRDNMSRRASDADEESNAESSQGSQTSVSTVASSSSSFSSSSSSSNSTLLTPPYSPFLQQSRPLLPPEYEMSLDRQLSWSSSTSNVSTASGNSVGPAAAKKRNVDSSSVGASRTKSKASAKMAPYSINRELSPARSPPQTQQSVPRLAPTLAQQSPTASLPSSSSSTLLKDHIKPTTLMAPPMEKSVSESAVPKTVSGRHLANRKLHPVFSANFTLGDELGSGGFGFVVRATRDRDGMPVAVKFIWKNKVPTHGWVRDKELGVIPMEAFVLKAVDHPCVVKFVDLFDDDEFFYLVMEHHGSPWKAGDQPEAQQKDEGVALDKTVQLPSSPPSAPAMQQSKSQPCAAKSLVSPRLAVFPPGSNVATPVSIEEKAAPSPQAAAMERRSSCDLFECIEQHSRLPEDKAQWVFAQVVEAVYHLSRLGIYHRDIKDENCVVDSDFNVKLIDFGSAVITDVRKPTPYFNRFFGTMTFASSEILQGKQYRAPHAEMWSLGVLLSILLSGECPFPDPTSAIRGKLPTPKGSWNRDAFAILQACLHVDPDRRATIREVREHPWVAQAWARHGVPRPN